MSEDQAAEREQKLRKEIAEAEKKRRENADVIEMEDDWSDFNEIDVSVFDRSAFLEQNGEEDVEPGDILVLASLDFDATLHMSPEKALELARALTKRAEEAKRLIEAADG